MKNVQVLRENAEKYQFLKRTPHKRKCFHKKCKICVTWRKSREI